MNYIDAFEQVTDKDAALMTRRIAREEGLFCGYSAGAAVQGLLQLGHLLKKDHLVVVILHDHGSRYIGKVYNDQWMIERGFLDVEKAVSSPAPDRSIPIHVSGNFPTPPVTSTITLVNSEPAK